MSEDIASGCTNLALEILMRELLLCAPDYYGIEYEINPWMSRARGAETELAKSQWQGLHQI